MHPELQEAIDFHEAIVAEAGKALVGYETEKALANVVLMSEIPTTYDKDEQRQVNAGNLLLRGVPGIGKTFFGVIIAAISDAKFARIQGRADLQPTEVVGFQMINPATGAFITEFGPLVPRLGPVCHLRLDHQHLDRVDLDLDRLRPVAWTIFETRNIDMRKWNLHEVIFALSDHLAMGDVFLEVLFYAAPDDIAKPAVVFPNTH